MLKNKLKIKYLFTGTGRCGTVFTARLMNLIGIPCGHESIFTYEGLDAAKARINRRKAIIQSNVYAHSLAEEHEIFVDSLIAESSYMAAPFLSDHVFIETVVFHLIRHPEDYVQSLANYLNFLQNPYPMNEYETFKFKHVPELAGKMPKYDRCALYYIRWNQMIAKHNPDYVFKTEEIEKKLLDLFLYKKEVNLPKDVNTCKKQNVERFRIDMIESVEIRKSLEQIGKQYGFMI
jgi:hypothetical protein